MNYCKSAPEIKQQTDAQLVNQSFQINQWSIYNQFVNCKTSLEKTFTEYV